MQTLNDILTLGRTVCKAPGVSQKKLFETAAHVISDDKKSLSYELIFSSLLAREKLGSTGLGKGIAIPHCRVNKCDQAIGTLVTLQEPINFDAPDDQAVDILFILLVPEEAQQQHLDILAGIARLFSQDDFCSQLRSASNAQELYTTATHWTS
ncbi:MAG: PTS system nitrogen regulatory IIA component [Halioglobus sp.]|jgi:PTS system nitrogen regulatory IIA component